MHEEWLTVSGITKANVSEYGKEGEAKDGEDQFICSRPVVPDWGT